ncbi:MAG: hypothetical protein EA423_10130 [Phycisphaerales bacterium]|nr:MAG: hypothetical protein EA423_10130 [Phycisphaerales bacterium]
MKQPFYLVSISCGDPIAVRECVYLRTFLTKPTNTQMHLVAIDPHVEGVDYLGARYFADKLLLVTIDEWSLEQTVADEYIVDICTLDRIPGPGCDIIDVADVKRLEMGTLFATREKAEERLAYDNRP